MRGPFIPGGAGDTFSVSMGCENAWQPAHDAWFSAHLQLEGATMPTAELLSIHTNLQRLELRNNELTDLSAVSSLKYLTSLDASHNKITEVSIEGHCPTRQQLPAAANRSLSFPGTYTRQ